MDTVDLDTFTAYALMVVFIIIFLGMVSIVYEDNVAFANIKKLRCKLGLHKTHKKSEGLKVAKYYCEYCKKPRKYPSLKVVDGGSKLKNNRFKF